MRLIDEVIVVLIDESKVTVMCDVCLKTKNIPTETPFLNFFMEKDAKKQKKKYFFKHQVAHRATIKWTKYITGTDLERHQQLN